MKVYELIELLSKEEAGNEIMINITLKEKDLKRRGDVIVGDDNEISYYLSTEVDNFWTKDNNAENMRDDASIFTVVLKLM